MKVKASAARALFVTGLGAKVAKDWPLKRLTERINLIADTPFAEEPEKLGGDKTMKKLFAKILTALEGEEEIEIEDDGAAEEEEAPAKKPKGTDKPPKDEPKAKKSKAKKEEEEEDDEEDEDEDEVEEDAEEADEDEDEDDEEESVPVKPKKEKKGDKKKDKKAAKAEKVAKPKKAPGLPGVRSKVSRPYAAGAVLKKAGLDKGITDKMVADTDKMYSDSNPGKEANPRESKFCLRNAWHAINAFLGNEPKEEE